MNDAASRAGPAVSSEAADALSAYCEDQSRCAPDVVRRQLQRIVNSADFDASARNRRFLRYVVEEVLAGRAERIKAYSIATTVFGRDPSFDPQTDAIVRIEARRLRRSLERYYLTGGKDDHIRITIPKGSYSAKFDVAVGTPDMAGVGARPQPPSTTPHGPAILVVPFDEDGELSAFPGFTRGFMRQLVVSLTRFGDLVVFGPETARGNDLAADPATLRARFSIDYVLRGGATASGDHLTVEALLVDARSGRNVWAASFERRLDRAEIVTVRDEVASNIARTVAQPYGVIFSSTPHEFDGKPPEALSTRECVTLFYQYWRSPSRESHNWIRACLEATIARAPDYAEAFACLSLVYSDAYQFAPPDEGGGIDPRQRALELALRAVELAPHSCRAHQALSLVYWLSHDHAGSLEELEIGRALNPNDAAILADLGLRYSLLTDWVKAVPLLEESYARNPLQSARYRFGLALFHYMHGRYERALVEARKIGIRHAVWSDLLEAVAAGQLGRHQEARAAVQRLVAIDPAYADHALADLMKHGMAFDLIQAVLGGLGKAGLTGRDCSAMASVGDAPQLGPARRWENLVAIGPGRPRRDAMGRRIGS